MKSSNKYKLFTEQEDYFLLTNYPALSIKEIARQLNRWPHSVNKRLQKLGIHIKRNVFTNEEKKFLIDNYKTLSVPELAKRLNRHPQHIYGKLSELGLSVKKCRFTPEDDEWILNNRHRYTIRQMAKMFGVPKTTLQSRYNTLSEKLELDRKRINKPIVKFIKPEPKQEKKIIKFQEPKPFVRPKAEYSNKGYEYLLNKYS